MAPGFKSGGRQAGTPNKRTVGDMTKAAATGQLPLDYMLKVMRNKKADAHRRDDMAKAAAPYLHAKVTTDNWNMNLKGLNGGGEHNAEVSGIRVEFVKPSHIDE